MTAAVTNYPSHSLSPTRSEHHSSKVKSFLLDILCPLITESDSVSNELLDIILCNIVEPQKSTRKNAYFIAKEVVTRTAEALKTYVQAFCNQILLSDKLDKNYSITPKIYELIYELNVLQPSLLLTILPQLEFKLKSSKEQDRVKVVVLLARMFSEKESVLSKQHTSLWRTFLGRFYDIASTIRIKCVQSSMHFLLNQPHLRRDITEALRERNHDNDEVVRYEVVMAIVETAKRDFQIIDESEDLLTFVKERTLDKKFKVRKEAMNGLALIYKKYLSDVTGIAVCTKRATNWIKDKILHGYYMKGIEDRLLVERLLITCLVPYQLPAEERMKKLLKLLGTIDENATKAFVELQRNQLKVRKLVAEWIKLHRVRAPDANLITEMNVKCKYISKQLPDPLKALEYLQKFSQQMRTDPRLVREMDTILRKDVSCKECADTMTTVLKRLGQPIMTNLYYNTIKMLLERIASVMVDQESVGYLVGLVEECVAGGSDDLCEEIDLVQELAGERALKILSVLASVFSVHFLHEQTLSHMVSLLGHDQEYVAPYVLKAFTQLGRFRPMRDLFPEVMKNLEPVCKEFAMSGTPKQAKHAILCMYVNAVAPGVTSSTSAAAAGAAAALAGNSSGGGENHQGTLASAPESVKEGESDLFGDIVDSLKVTLNADHECYRTAIVSLGHIAQHMPERFLVPVKNLISRKIVKELLVRDVEDERENVPLGDWCEEEELPEETRCKVEGLKTMARWLLGLKKDVPSAQKTFRMLYAFMKQRGDLLDQKRISPAEMSWLRLSAGKAMLKICEQQGVGDQFTPEQFYMLSQLMLDPVLQVREQFVRKLHKGLYKGMREKCLPIDFMGIYALGGREKNPKLFAQIKSFVELDVIRRREFVKTAAGGPLDAAVHILPDYMLGFAVPVLTHDPNFTNSGLRQQLLQIEKCLWLILEPLITSKEFFSFAFYKNLVDRMKNHKDALLPDDEEMNTVSGWWAFAISSSYYISLSLYTENVGNLRHCHAPGLHQVGELRHARRFHGGAHTEYVLCRAAGQLPEHAHLHTQRVLYDEQEGVDGE